MKKVETTSNALLNGTPTEETCCGDVIEIGFSPKHQNERVPSAFFSHLPWF